MQGLYLPQCFFRGVISGVGRLFSGRLLQIRKTAQKKLCQTEKFRESSFSQGFRGRREALGTRLVSVSIVEYLGEPLETRAVDECFHISRSTYQTSTPDLLRE
ncbi:hypothetical protein OS493_035567 [Desmophyllum pertusum]|uniref:Uncharacterized protein n=1 Tax=Desmophyllum pertusum TaxID=174260 RepID=A0A9X0D7T2_9CNID|nr:hypothetical protein OS493_035567 [Desmophyllum pertusum]